MHLNSLTIWPAQFFRISLESHETGKAILQSLCGHSLLRVCCCARGGVEGTVLQLQVLESCLWG